MNITDLAHAFGKVRCCAALRDLHFAPWPVDVQEDEEVGRAVAPVLSVVAFQLSGFGRNRLAHLADQLGWAFVEANHRPLGIGRFRIEIEHILHARDIFGIDLGKRIPISAPQYAITTSGRPVR